MPDQCDKCVNCYKEGQKCSKTGRRLYYNFLVCSNYKKAIFYIIPVLVALFAFLLIGLYKKDLGRFDLLIAEYVADASLGQDNAYWLNSKFMQSTDDIVKFFIVLPHILEIAMCIVTVLVPFFKPLYTFHSFFPCALLFSAQLTTVVFSLGGNILVKKMCLRPRPSETIGCNDGEFPEEEYCPFVDIFDTSKMDLVKKLADYDSKKKKFTLASTFSTHVNTVTTGNIALCMTITMIFNLIEATFRYHYNHIEVKNEAAQCKYAKTKKIIYGIKIPVLFLTWANLIIMCPVMMGSRIVSGNHFFTDTLGAVMLSICTSSLSMFLWPNFDLYYERIDEQIINGSKQSNCTTKIPYKPNENTSAELTDEVIPIAKNPQADTEEHAPQIEDLGNVSEAMAGEI